MSEMIQVPDGWKIFSLRKEINILSGFAFESEKFNESKNGIQLIRIRDLTNNFSNTFFSGQYSEEHLVKSGDILIGMDGEFYVVKWAGAEGLLNQRVCKIKKSNIDYDLLYYALKPHIQEIENKTASTTVKHLSVSDIYNLELILPKEKKEQEKIAKILSTLDKAIESTNRLIEKEKNIKKALMQELLTNGIDKDGHIRTRTTHTYKESELGLIPEEWEVVSLYSFFKLKSGDTKPEDTSDSGIYEVYGGNGITGYSNSKNNNEETLIIGRVGEYCGNVYLVNECWITDNALYITKKVKKFDTKYMFYLLYFLNLNQYKSETGQPLLNQTIIGNVKTSHPINLDEQKQIAKILTTQDKKIQTEETNLAKLKELKKGLMNDLLSGKVRVKV